MKRKELIHMQLSADAELVTEVSETGKHHVHRYYLT